MSDENLDQAVRCIDGAREHANRGLHGLAESWGSETTRCAGETLERAISLLTEAESLITATEPHGLWSVFHGDPERPYLNRAISLAFSARQIVGAALKSGQVRTSLPGSEVADLLGSVGVRLDSALDHMMGVAVGATSFSDLVAEAVALGADPHEELLRQDGWHGVVRDTDGKLVAYLFGCESRDVAMKFAFDHRRSAGDCHAWVMEVAGGQLQPGSVEEVLSGY